MKRRKRWMPRQWGSRQRYTGPLDYLSGVHGRRLVLHTEGVDRPKGDPDFIARYVNDKCIPYHATWDPRTGKWCQAIPFDRPARSLMNGGINGGVGCNRTGEVVIQVCVVGFAGGAWSKFPHRIKGAWVLDEIVTAWGIPWRSLCHWPCPDRSLTKWYRSGVTCHAAAPGNDHTDGGGTNFKRLRRVARRQNRARKLRARARRALRR